MLLVRMDAIEERSQNILRANNPDAARFSAHII